METSSKKIVGKNNRKYTMQKGIGHTTIRLNCNYAGVDRNLAILQSLDGVNFRRAEGGTPQINNFIKRVIESNDLSKRFPNIKIVD